MEIEKLNFQDQKEIETSERKLQQINSLKEQGIIYIEFDGDAIQGYDYPLIAQTLPIETAIELVERDLKAAKSNQQELELYRRYVEEAFAQVESLYRKIFMTCLEIHQPEGIIFHAAIEYFLAEDYQAAIEKIDFLSTFLG